MKRVGLAAVAVLLLAASSAQAATPSIDIHSAGPLSDIYVGKQTPVRHYSLLRLAGMLSLSCGPALSLLGVCDQGGHRGAGGALLLAH